MPDSGSTTTSAPLRPPPARRLRVYAFDPNAALELGSAKYSHATISLAWDDPADGELRPGPVNDYLEVIDFDPCSQQFYEPVDLNAPEVLAQDGLPPSERDPRFHQQMVFAVIMKTIKLFERALGRKVIWASAWNDKTKTYDATLKLRVYPHALREANAYYSPTKQALLFGYFNATQRSAGASWIFTALSHDIIVHETTHAILDGLHRRYSEPTSVDSLAFHEAFADIAALFSHFQLYEAVYEFITNCGGRLDQTGLLSSLAGQFAKGTSGHPSLRDYIDTSPDPEFLAQATEPHDRGAILVAAVFDAFLSIYRARIEDLLRMSNVRLGTSQTLHPDLIARLTKEATKTADHVLRMCIRALDYLPPVDVRFGEFLRAVITADADLIPDDRLHYRLAFVEAFRQRGIYAEHCLSMSPDNLLWEEPPSDVSTDDILDCDLELFPTYRRSDVIATAERNRRKVWYWLNQPFLTVDGGKGDKGDTKRLGTVLSRARVFFSREAAPTRSRAMRAALDAFVDSVEADLKVFGSTAVAIKDLRRQLLGAKTHIDQWDLFLGLLRSNCPRLTESPGVDRAWESALGIYFQRPSLRAPDPPGAEPASPLYSIPGTLFGLQVEVHSVRTTRRAGPDGQDIRQLVVEITQRRHGYFDPADQAARDATDGEFKLKDFNFRGGATLIIDLRDGKLRYIVRKSIADDQRLVHQRQFLTDANTMSFTYHRGRAKYEPFALLHRH